VEKKKKRVTAFRTANIDHILRYSAKAGGRRRKKWKGGKKRKKKKGGSHEEDPPFCGFFFISAYLLGAKIKREKEKEAFSFTYDDGGGKD